MRCLCENVRLQQSWCRCGNIRRKWKSGCSSENDLLHYDLIHGVINPTSKSCNAYEPILQVLQIIKEWCTVKDGWQAKLVERNLSCVMISSYWWWRRRSWRSWLSDMMLIMQSIPVWCCQCPVREKIISGVWCSPIEEESRTNKCSPDD